MQIGTVRSNQNVVRGCSKLYRCTCNWYSKLYEEIMYLIIDIFLIIFLLFLLVANISH